MPFAIAALLALAVSFAVCRLLISAGPRDLPGEARKAHDAPTPTGGGLAIACGAVAGWIALIATPDLQQPPLSELWQLGWAPLGFLLVGFVDDTRGLSAPVKAAVFLVLAVAGAIGAGPVESFPLGADLAISAPAAIGITGAALWVFTLVNGVNFVDGANGVATGSMAIALAAAGLLAWVADAPVLAVAALCVVAAILGFLIWNFPFGRIFAGDSGALSLGAFGALMSLALIEHARLSPFVPPILFFPILADVLLTLMWRARQGARLMDAHADHFYQLALKAWRSHTRVALAFWAAMGACATLAVFVARDPDPSLAWKALMVLAVISVAASEIVRRATR